MTRSDATNDNAGSVAEELSHIRYLLKTINERVDKIEADMKQTSKPKGKDSELRMILMGPPGAGIDNFEISLVFFEFFRIHHLTLTLTLFFFSFSNL